MTNAEIINNLRTYCNDLLSYAHMTTENAKRYYDQAFGAAEFAIWEHSELFKEIDKMWSGFRAEFETIIYGG